jgi:hypothetical protein
MFDAAKMPHLRLGGLDSLGSVDKEYGVTTSGCALTALWLWALGREKLLSITYIADPASFFSFGFGC